MKVMLYSLPITSQTKMTYHQIAAAANLASLGVVAVVHLADPLCQAPTNRTSFTFFFFHY